MGSLKAPSRKDSTSRGVEVVCEVKAHESQVVVALPIHQMITSNAMSYVSGILLDRSTKANGRASGTSSTQKPTQRQYVPLLSSISPVKAFSNSHHADTLSSPRATKSSTSLA